MIDQLDGSRLTGPVDQDRQQQHQDRAIIERQQRMIDAFAGRQPAAQILLDKVHQGDDEFGGQHGDHDHREHAMHFEPAEHEEQQRIEKVADAVELQFMAL